MKVRPTKTPGIPDIRDDNVVEVLRAIKSTMEVREAHSGDPVDAHVTFRQLTALGLTVDGKSKSASGDGSDLPVTGPGNGLGPGGYDPSGDLSIPPAPTNLTVDGTFTNMYLTWEGGFKNPAFTEIWRNTVDDLSTAVLVGTSPVNLYTDPVDFDSTYWYWVRFVSQANVAGPYNSQSGTMGHTSMDIGKAIEALSADLLNSPLWAALSQRIDKIEADAYVINRGQDSKLEELAVADGRSRSRLLDLWNVTQSQATDIKLLESRGPGNGNAIYFTPERPDAATPGFISGLPLNAGDIWYDTDDDNRSYRWSGLDWIEFVTAGAKVYHQATDPASFNGTDWVDVDGRILREGDIWYDSDDANHPYRWSSATNTWLDIAGGDNSADIITLEQTKIGYATLNVNSPAGLAGAVFDNGGAIWNNVASGAADYANSAQFYNSTHVDNPGLDSKVTWHVGLPFAQAVKQVGITTDGGTTHTTIEQQFIVMQQNDTNILAQYTVKIDVNGYVIGFGLAASGPASAPTSAFIVNADKFAIGPAIPAASWNGAVAYTKYTTVKMVQGGVTHVFQARQDIAANSGHQPVWDATTVAQDAWWVDLTARLPFIATTLTQVIDGKTYPPGVWMNTANIADAHIIDAQIQSLIADKIITGKLKATISIETGKIYGGILNFLVPVGDPAFGVGFFLGNDGGTQKFFIGEASTNYLMWDGQHTLKVQGHIEGLSGHIGGISMRYDSTGQVGNLFAPETVTGFNSGAQGFYLDSAGKFRIGLPNGSRMTWDGAGLNIYGSGNQLILGAGGFDWNAINGTPPASVNNSSVTMTVDGRLLGGGGGAVTAVGLGAVQTSLANAPGSILNQNVNVVAGPNGTISMTGAGSNAIPGVVMPGWQINATNVGTYIGSAAIKQAYIGLLAVGAAQIADLAVVTAKIDNLAVDTLKVAGNAITVPSVAGFTNDEVVGFASEYYLFGGNPNAAVLQFALNDAAEMSLVTFTTELVQGSGTQGAVIQLTCYINRDGVGGALVASRSFRIGIINNQPRFTQTAVFPFPGLPANNNLVVRISAKQIPDGEGKTNLVTNNILGNKIISITGMKK